MLAIVILSTLLGTAMLIWAVSAAIYYPWANDCKDAGNLVQEYGYGIPMLTSTYVCVDSNGNAVDWL